VKRSKLVITCSKAGGPTCHKKARLLLETKSRRAGLECTSEYGRCFVDGIQVSLPGCSRPETKDSPPKLERGNAVLSSDGEWSITYEGRTAVLPDSVGFRYCCELLTQPGLQLHATHLVTSVHGEPMEIFREEELTTSDVAFETVGMDFESGKEHSGVCKTEFLDEILPDEARGRILLELELLRAEVGVLRAQGSTLRMCSTLRLGAPREIAVLEEDIRVVEQYLATTRFQDRNTTFDSRGQRDRKSVSIAIRRTIVRLEKHHPELAKHLDVTIKTGKYCLYDPKPIVKWTCSKPPPFVAPE
jgi:hypothetical protein